MSRVSERAATSLDPPAIAGLGAALTIERSKWPGSGVSSPTAPLLKLGRTQAQQGGDPPATRPAVGIGEGRGIQELRPNSRRRVCPETAAFRRGIRIDRCAVLPVEEVVAVWTPMIVPGPNVSVGRRVRVPTNAAA